jgi:Tetratricopeptide repeat
MKLKFHIALAVGCGLVAGVGLFAQSAPTQQKPPANKQPPASTQPAQKPAEANPFPQDTNNIPVVPTSGEPAPPPPPAASDETSPETTSLLKSDTDPVHSPDDPPPDASASDSGFSSSLTGANDINIPDEPPKSGKHKKTDEPAVHQVTAKDDEDVGEFELSRKNWKAALSRYQSALVTDPENPDVYWGIAESQRQLGDYANAKANYLKVMEYDPDSKHAKEAKKLLKDPQLANAPAVSANQQPQ